MTPEPVASDLVDFLRNVLRAQTGVEDHVGELAANLHTQLEHNALKGEKITNGVRLHRNPQGADQV